MIGVHGNNEGAGRLPGENNKAKSLKAGGLNEKPRGDLRVGSARKDMEGSVRDGGLANV